MLRIRLRKALWAILLLAFLSVTLYVFQNSVLDNRFYSLPSSNDNINRVLIASETITVPRDVLIEPKPTTCNPVRNVAFIKTHKAGSTTIANILQRFGVAHHLNFALPRKQVHTFGFNYIVRAGERFSTDKLIPLPNGENYNVLWCHSIYNKTAFRQVLPDDTAYISIIREPFQQFVSTVEYYGGVKVFFRMYPSISNEKNPISAFLSKTAVHAQRIYPNSKHYSYMRNKQSQDLGFGEEEAKIGSNLQTYLADLEHDFALIMIMERFDESLLLLKHKLCWEMRDILYIPKNKNKHKPNRTFTEEDHSYHRLYSGVDHALYDHFQKVFNETLKKQGEVFFQELSHFKSLLSQVQHSCAEKRSIAVQQTRWHDSFNVTTQDCKWMMYSEIEGLTMLIARMGLPV